MAVEIRELVIKTTLHDTQPERSQLDAQQLARLREEILRECRRLLQEQAASSLLSR